MESSQLTTFFRSLSTWPRNEPELNSAADKLARLLDASFVAVISDFDERKRVFGVSPPVRLTDALRELFGDNVKTQAGGLGLPRAVQLDPRPELPAGVARLTIAPIVGETRGDIGREAESSGRGRRDFGFILVGSSKSLGTKEEIGLVAACQRFAELAELEHFEDVIGLRSQFLSIASHELKTPLTSIYGMLQLQERMLKIKKDEPEQAQRERQESYLKMVIRQVKRLNELIDGLLDISRIQNNRFNVEHSETDVSALLTESVSSRLQIIASEAGVRLELDCPQSLVAFVDPLRMEEVAINLVMNAIRFSPEGGTVWIVLKPEGESFRLSVRDQGPAVPIEDRDRIFQPFERAQRTGRLGGLGLGLFISRQIAQLHGGNVSLIESLPGSGNVFEAYFPRRGMERASA